MTAPAKVRKNLGKRVLILPAGHPIEVLLLGILLIYVSLLIYGLSVI
jgi:hypothetical protein